MRLRRSICAGVSGLVNLRTSLLAASQSSVLTPVAAASSLLFAIADVAITKTDGVTTATPGGSVTYTIVASNAGPDPAPSSTVADTFPAALTCTWTSAGAGGGTCTAAVSGGVGVRACCHRDAGGAAVGGGSRGERGRASEARAAEGAQGAAGDDDIG